MIKACLMGATKKQMLHLKPFRGGFVYLCAEKEAEILYMKKLGKKKFCKCGTFCSEALVLTRGKSGQFLQFLLKCVPLLA